MTDYKTTSFDLKLALLQYFRFQRQWICVDEFHGADIIADTGKEIIEVEVKITKSDLINGEKKKVRKHQAYRQGHSFMMCSPNKFMFCVPEKLVDATLTWSTELNEQYGVIGFDTERLGKAINQNWAIWHSNYIRIAKSAKALHDRYSDKVRWNIARRASAKLTILTQQIFSQKLSTEAEK